MVRLFFTGLCAGMLLGSAGCGGSAAGAEEGRERESALYRKAFAAEQSGDLQEAIRLYNQVLVDEPKAFSAHFQLATLLHDHSEDYVGAIFHYKQFLYLQPKTQKRELVQDRIRIAEQLLAPQILRKVGDSVQGISQAHLLKENERLNRVITTLEGEKSVLAEAKAAAEKERDGLRSDNVRLRAIVDKIRIGEPSEAPEPLAKRVEAVSGKAEKTEKAGAGLGAESVRALRAEAEALSAGGGKPGTRKPLVEMPSTETVLQKVQTRLTGTPVAEPAPQTSAVAVASGSAETSDKKGKTSPLSALSLFGRENKKEKEAKPGAELRTYVVQPGDTLFRVAEKFYGDSTQWKKIRDANRTRIDPDGRIRAGQIITVP